MWVKLHVVVKHNSKVPQSGARGHNNTIQVYFLVRQCFSEMLRANHRPWCSSESESALLAVYAYTYKEFDSGVVALTQIDTQLSTLFIYLTFLSLFPLFFIYPDSRWQTTNQNAAQRQTELETCADRLGSFASAANQLGPWLREKELMMSVLGPLSIDPNMLTTQKQQVQVCGRHTRDEQQLSKFTYSNYKV